MEEEKIVKIAKPGKPWKIESFHRDFESADALRNKLMRIWKAEIENLVKEIQINEKLTSMRQVFERYPSLGEMYYKEQQGEEVDVSQFKEDITKSKKLLLD